MSIAVQIIGIATEILSIHNDMDLLSQPTF